MLISCLKLPGKRCIHRHLVNKNKTIVLKKHTHTHCPFRGLLKTHSRRGEARDLCPHPPVSQLQPLATAGEPEHLCALLYSVCKTQCAPPEGFQRNAALGRTCRVNDLCAHTCVCACRGGVGVWWRDTWTDKYQQCNYTPDTLARSTCASRVPSLPLQSRPSDWPPGTLCMRVR